MINTFRGFAVVASLAALVAFTSAAARADAPVAAADPCGCWCGTWCSSTNGHNGPIKAKICRCEGNCYRANFHGRFMALIPFQYSVPLTVTGQTADGKTLLSGQSRLPLFGDFCCNVEVTDCQFTATYTSCKDQGQFTMTRR